MTGCYFNPRSRGGSDSPLVIFSPQPSPFQSTLPRRERHVYPEGNRRDNEFQSTLPRRERHYNTHMWLHKAVFQSTLPRRERRDWHSLRIVPAYFNPRSRGGSDLRILSMPKFEIPFQSTLPRRERQLCVTEPGQKL